MNEEHFSFHIQNNISVRLLTVNMKNGLKPAFHQRISVSISTSTCVSKWKLGRHKRKHKDKKNGQVRSSWAYANVVALTMSENWVDIDKHEISTRPTWTNHRSFCPRPHANIWKAIWRTLRPPSCLSLDWGELVSRIESNMPFCVCVCPYAYGYALVKTRFYPKNPKMCDPILVMLLKTRPIIVNPVVKMWPH